MKVDGLFTPIFHGNEVCCLEKIHALIQKYWDILSYLFFGVLTTAVNFLVYTPLYHYLELSATVSNVIAWTVSVLFAFLTNKPFVFKSHDWSAGVVLPELGKFTACRVGSGLLETGFLALTVDVLQLNGLVMKVIASVFVVIANYAGSKLLVFRKKLDKE